VIVDLLVIDGLERGLGALNQQSPNQPSTTNQQSKINQSTMLY
jgi:hypothetical protein